jgi:hypothetical protein
MTVDFDILKRNELRAAARLVGRAFEDYEYFTNYFPDLKERRKVLGGVVYREYLTNFKRTHYLVVKMNGELVAVAQINAPDYKKPSDFQYLIHGWPLVYRGVNRQRLDDWLAMDAAAGRPCHEYQATGTRIWYLSSITVDPSAQGIGKQFIPRKQVPYIRYLQRREDQEHIQLPREIYEDRLEQYRLRIEAMLRYAQTSDRCRNRMLLAYFGEKSSTDCGQCDVCLSGQGRLVTPEGQQDARQRILTLLPDRQRHHITELYRLQLPTEELDAALAFLIKEEKIRQDDGFIQLV